MVDGRRERSVLLKEFTHQINFPYFCVAKNA